MHIARTCIYIYICTIYSLNSVKGYIGEYKRGYQRGYQEVSTKVRISVDIRTRDKVYPKP